MYKILKWRDLQIIDIGDKSLVISCDSSGSIGNKENDFLQVAPYFVGAFTARVAIMEALSVGASVISISNGICNDMATTGCEIIQGIRDEAKKIELQDISITGSTEENFPTTMTGVGLTVVAIIKNSLLNFEKIDKGDLVGLCGLPKVGNEINLQEDSDLVTYDDIKNFVKWEGAKEVIPCGSKGITYECDNIGQLSNLNFVKYENFYSKKNGKDSDLTTVPSELIDLNKSCGPATCAIIIIKKEFKNFIINTKSPFFIIGEYK